MKPCSDSYRLWSGATVCGLRTDSSVKPVQSTGRQEAGSRCEMCGDLYCTAANLSLGSPLTNMFSVLSNKY